MGKSIQRGGNPAWVGHGTQDRDGLFILTGSKAAKRPVSEEGLHAFTGMGAASINIFTIRDSFENDNLLHDGTPISGRGRR